MRFVLAGTMLALALVAGCGQKSPVVAEEPPPGEAWLAPQQMTDTHMVVETVGEHQVDATVAASGRITFDDMHVGHVFSPVTGRVTKILANLGDHVAKGAPIATIMSPDVGVASSDLGKANADLVAAKHDLTRQKELFEAHAAPKRDYEVAEDNYGKAKAELDRAKQKANLLQAGTIDLVTQSFTLRSPIDGEVLARNLSIGMEVQGQYSGGANAELFTIGEIDPIWAVAEVYEMDLPTVKRGAKVAVHVVSYPGKDFAGIVDWVSDTLDPVTRTARVRCTLPNKERELKPEMFATITIDVHGQEVLAVPRSTVLHLGDQTVAFVKSGPAPGGRIRFVRRPIKVDEDDDGDWVPVLRGLVKGEQVVASQGILLSALAKP